MNRYRLVKLISAVDRVDTRKRLQKCLYLVQLAGGNLGADYRLHYFGPYSKDVADATDELVLRDFLEETESPNVAGRQFSYEVTGGGKEFIQGFERAPEGNREPESMGPFIEQFKRLNEVPLWILELASTLSYYRSKGADWDESRTLTAQFKQQDPQSSAMDQAEALARQFVE